MADFSTLFGAHGVLANALSGFRSRTSQQRMAARIAEALEQRQLLLVEAGTGTGKTFAYLVPVLLSGRRTLISTGTRTLQDQLFHRDLPLLAAALGRPARVALLKGRGNYLCRERLEAFARQQSLLAGADPLLVRVEEWAGMTRAGDLAEIPELGESHPLRSQITSTRENCLGTRCPHLGNCAVLEARRQAIEADVVVVNHHLLLADLALKEDGFGDLLPSFEAVILDEAHQLPDLVSEFFGVSLSSRQVEVLASDIRNELRAQGAEGDLAAKLVAPLERALSDCVAAFGRQERLIAWAELPPSAVPRLEDLADALADCSGGIERLSAGAGMEQCAERIRSLAAALATLLDESSDSEASSGARTAAVQPRGFLLRLLPYDVSGRFNTLLRSHPGAWIFTSATLAVGEDFSHFASRLGLTGAETARFESPFDYQRQALLYLPPALPEPAQAGFTAAVVAMARPLLEAARGGAFLLFTSHRALQAAAALLRTGLPVECPLLVQGEAPREQLLRRFRASGHAVLLGTASFWEGIDVQGDALRLVIIDKLPFNSPEDPIVRARVEHLESQGVGAFRHYQLPEAVLALKQGVGRLIRSETDRGVVVLCDPRLQSKSYGRVFLSSLPPMRRVADVAPVLALLRELAVAPGLPSAVHA